MLSVLNVSEREITINGRKILGHVHDADEAIGNVPPEMINEVNEWKSENSHLAGATFGKNLTEAEKSKLVAGGWGTENISVIPRVNRRS